MIAIDSSSLILMAKAGILDKVITSLKRKIIATTCVYSETTKTEAFDAQIIKKRVEEKAIEKKGIKNLKLFSKIKDDFNLGNGEAEAIVFCLENKAGLITDDKKAMNACRLLRISFTTAPTLLIRLYKRNLITKMEASMYLDKLEKFGRYSENILQNAKEELK